MKDFLLRELAIDDYVIMITPGYRDFTLARVVGFTPQKVRVVTPGDEVWRGRPMTQAPHQLVIVKGAELTMYLLKTTAK